MTPLNRLLFVDIETVGVEKDYKTLVNSNKELAHQFEKYEGWMRKRFPEDENLTIEELFSNRAALIPEFNKIIVVSFGFITDNGEVKIQTFKDDDETKLLEGVHKLLTRTGKLDFYLCGHNIKTFDVPVLAKRMVVNGIKLPDSLKVYDKKPWELKMTDSKELWQFGSFGSISTLELMCVSLGVESSKNMEVSGDKVHRAYWNENKLDSIAEYCEKDVEVLIEAIKKIYPLL